MWLWGKPGAGKSLLVSTMWPEAYKKDVSIWFDNYSNQEVVWLDEVNKAICLEYKQSIKRWSDSYRFNIQVKGGFVQSNWILFVVTS